MTFVTLFSLVVLYVEVCLQVSARDVDTGAGGQVHYSCERGCGGALEVRRKGGVVMVAGRLDRETQPRHVLVVVASDTDPRLQFSATATVLIDGKQKFTRVLTDKHLTHVFAF